MYEPLSKETIEKYDRELVELHKRVLTTTLIEEGAKAKTRRKFFQLYDMYIDEKNIREYFHRDSRLFIYALITSRLDEIKDYFKDE
jgi:hypothetical protein